MLTDSMVFLGPFPYPVLKIWVNFWATGFVCEATFSKQQITKPPVYIEQGAQKKKNNYNKHFKIFLKIKVKLKSTALYEKV